MAEIMASECRYSRRLLSKKFIEFMQNFIKDKNPRRLNVFQSPLDKNKAYILLQLRMLQNETWEEYCQRRNFLLYASTIILKKDYPIFTTILGIGMEPIENIPANKKIRNFSLLRCEKLTDKDIENATKWQNEFNILNKNKREYKVSDMPEYRCN